MRKREQFRDKLRERFRDELYMWLHSTISDQMYAQIWEQLKDITLWYELRDQTHQQLYEEKIGK
jgi:hypothetical protein